MQNPNLFKSSHCRRVNFPDDFITCTVLGWYHGTREFEENLSQIYTYPAGYFPLLPFSICHVLCQFYPLVMPFLFFSIVVFYLFLFLHNNLYSLQHFIFPSEYFYQIILSVLILYTFSSSPPFSIHQNET